MPYREAITNLPQEYGDCPQHCPKNRSKPYDVYREDRCDECPRAIKLAGLERTVEQKWDTWFTEEQRREFPERAFHEAMRVLYQVTGLRDKPDDQVLAINTVLLSVFIDEEARAKKAKT